MTDSPPTERPAPPGIDTTQAHSARVYDFLLGGKDNYAADRVVAEGLLSVLPEAGEMARRNRLFVARAVRHLVADLGIDQILDVGAGIPTAPAVHTIAREINPDVRVAYTDHDRIVLAHDRALLSTEPGVLTILGDVTAPETILDSPDLGGLFDWTRPVAVIFAALFHFVPDSVEPLKIMAGFRERLAPGSAVVLSMISSDGVPEDVLARGEAVYSRSASPLTMRTGPEVARFFTGFRVLEPGIVTVDDWRPTDDGLAPLAIAGGLCGVGVLDA